MQHDYIINLLVVKKTYIFEKQRSRRKIALHKHYASVPGGKICMNACRLEQVKRWSSQDMVQ